ncbi:hypothetical protein AMTRI_Chr07g31180 [Amborella trichopoda]
MTMARNGFATATVSSLLLLFSVNCIMDTEAINIGVNYGTVANNLPPPTQVAKFLKENTLINHVKLFGIDHAIIQAFANTGIALTVAIPNDQIPSLRRLAIARQWIQINILPYVYTTKIIRILVGNEVLHTNDILLAANLIPAMQNLHAVLIGASLDHQIKVSTPHSLGILSISTPPSAGRFRRGYTTLVLKPLLSFLRATNAPFMINPYPYFGFTPNTLDFALFRPNKGVFDVNTHLTYTNMLDGQLDAIYSAMKRLGFTDVEIVIAETGWPSIGDPGQIGVSVANAAAYNGNLIRHVNSGIGTPLMPNQTFETYIFSLFNENLKLGPIAERNFGLFRPDFVPVYDIGILRSEVKARMPAPINPTPLAPINQVPTNMKQWCLPKANADPRALQENIDYACGQGLDCRPIQIGGACFLPNTIQAHAAYAMNAYYQSAGRHAYDCDFKQTGAISTVDPSYGSCIYNS